MSHTFDIRPILLALALPLVACSTDRTVERYSMSFEAEALDELLLEHGAGDLTIVGEDGRQTIDVTATLRTSRSAAHDDDAKDNVVIDLVTPFAESGELLAEVPSPSGYYLDVQLLVPGHLAMTINDGSGDVVVRNLRTLTLDDGSGDAVIESITGAVAVVDGSGDLLIRAVGGSLVVSDDSGDLAVDQVAGDVVLDDGSGDVSVHDIEGHASIEDGSGDIAVSDVQGTVTVRDGSGDIVIGDAGGVEIPQSGSGDVHLD